MPQILANYNSTQILADSNVTGDLIGKGVSHEVADATSGMITEGGYILYPSADPPAIAPIVEDFLEQIAPGSTNPYSDEFKKEQGFYNFKERLAASVFRVEKPSPIQDRFILLQKWEGTIIEVCRDSFIARLVDLTERGADEEAEFDVDEVSVADRPLIEAGSVFYWSIGYTDTAGGQRRRMSIIRFRRLPMWTLKELEEAKNKAAKIREILEW